MPKTRGAPTQVVRAVRILRALQGRRLGARLDDLADELGVTRSQIRRDLLAIEEGGVHLAFDCSRDDVPPTDAPFSVDVDLSGLNSILYSLWASGFLDRQFAGALDWFNTSVEIREALSLMIDANGFTIPPTLRVLDAKAGAFGLGVEARVTLRDGRLVTPARVFGDVGLSMATDSGSKLRGTLALRDLALTCEPEPGRLVPCYSDLIDAVRHRAADVAQPQADRLVERIDDFVRNREVELGEFKYRIDRVHVSTRPDPPSGWLRADVYGGIGVIPP